MKNTLNDSNSNDAIKNMLLYQIDMTRLSINHQKIKYHNNKIYKTIYQNFITTQNANLYKELIKYQNKILLETNNNPYAKSYQLGYHYYKLVSNTSSQNTFIVKYQLDNDVYTKIYNSADDYNSYKNLYKLQKKILSIFDSYQYIYNSKINNIAHETYYKKYLKNYDFQEFIKLRLIQTNIIKILLLNDDITQLNCTIPNYLKSYESCMSKGECTDLQKFLIHQRNLLKTYQDDKELHDFTN